MGSSVGTYQTPAERAESERRYREYLAEKAKETQGAREHLAKKIVSVAIDQINQHIVRPGPHAEERECYDMADELRRFSDDLVALVVAQLNVNEGCK